MNKLQRTSICLFALVFVACAGSSEVLEETAPAAGPAAEKDAHNPCGRPVAMQDGLDLDVRERLGYVRGFEKSWKIPAWVACRLERGYYQPGAAKFDWVGRYLVDPDLEETGLITHNHYASTGFDRGQMAPDPAMQGRTEDVVRESYYMSNVAPQYPALSQRLWMNLESQVRKWARKYGRVYVISGPVFAGTTEGSRSFAPVDVENWMTPAKPGIDDKVAIPTHFFKIVYRKTGGELHAMAFIVPNQKERFDDDWDLLQWQVAISEVEALTGFNFLSRLHDDIEHPLESTKAEMWE